MNQDTVILRPQAEESHTVKQGVGSFVARYGGLLRMTLATLAAFLILLLAAPAYAQCVASCPAGQSSTGTCEIAPPEEGILCDGACVLAGFCEGTEGGSCQITHEGVTCGPAAAAQPGGAPTPTAVELPNPLGPKSIEEIVGNIIKVFTGGAGFIALLMFVYGGFQWLTAAGNPEKIKKGRDILLWSVLGIVVMFSSYIITNYLLRAILTGVVNP